jgi:hypothetical protein
LSTSYPFHEQTQIFSLISWIDNEMDMVGHQTVSVNFTSQLDFPFPEIIKVIQVITISSKHHLSVVTALNDVVRTVWQNYSGSTWHKKNYHPPKGMSKNKSVCGRARSRI